MKKTIAIILSIMLAIVISLPTAASSTTNTKNTAVKSLSFLIQNSALRLGYQALIDYINAHPELGAKLEVNKVADGNDGDQYIKVRLAAGEIPDILWWQNAASGQLASNNNSMFSDLKNAEWTKDYDAETLKSPAYTRNGKLICAPIGEVNLFGMVYNKKVFANAGIAKVPSTWNELLVDCAKIKAKNITPVYYSGKDSWTLQIIGLDSMVREQKGKPLQQMADALSTGKIKFKDLKLVIDGQNRMKQLIDKGLTQKSWLSDTYVSAQTALLDGTAGMYPMGSWIAADLNKTDAIKSDNIGFFPIPFDGNDPAYLGSPVGLYSLAASKNVNLAKNIISFMASKKGQNIYFNAQPGVPFMKGVNVKVSNVFADCLSLVNSGKVQMVGYDFASHNIADYATLCQQLAIGQITSEQVAAARDAAMAKDAKAKNDQNYK